MSPALAGQQRCREHGDRHLDDEDERGDVRRLPVLERAHLAEHGESGAQPGGQRPRHGREPLVSVERVGDELRRQPAPCERRARRHRHGDPADASAQGVRCERDGCERGERAGQRPAADVVRRGVGTDSREPCDAGDDRRDREHVARADALVERAGAEDEQQAEAERERRLHDGERGEHERGGLQRPADQAQRGARQPARPAGEADDERRPQPALGGGYARLERLQRDAEVVQARGGTGGRGADHDRRHGPAAP
jgi:hypothetical protein